jgi:flagellar biosynthetic protein FlhB
MADGEERTEVATPKRRQESRKKGQVARSQEIGSAFVILFGFLTLLLYGKTMYAYMANYMRFVLSPEVFVHFRPEQADVGHFFMAIFNVTARIVAPIFLVLVIVGVFFNIAQVGIMFTAEAMKPNFNKINPLQGLKRIFSLRSLTELVKSIIKISAVGIIGYLHIRGEIMNVVNLHDIPLAAGMVWLGTSIFWMTMKVALLLILLSLLDFIYQKWDFERSIKMTKQEVKDEHKQREGDPLVRSRIRQKQREIAMRRMMAEVPQADVVITNPVHIAVALTYVSSEMHAPKLVAKGAGVVADKIKEIAKEHGVPIIEDRPLAQSLFKSCEIGDFIPPNLFKAVAEILAYVFNLGKKAHKFGI